MSGLPIVLTVKGRPTLVVGGKDRAVPKVRRLLTAGAAVCVVAPAAGPEIVEFADQGRLVWRKRAFVSGDVRGLTVVFGATGNAAVDRSVAEAAAAAGVPANIVDGPELGDFTMPAIVDRDPVMVAISTDGTAPLLARKIRARIEAVLPENTGRLARFAAGFRSAVAATIPNPRARRELWQKVFDGSVADAVVRGDLHGARRTMLALINSSGTTRSVGHVAIVGAGPGNPDLLTLAALRLLEQADVVIHDRLVGPRILDYVRRDAALIDAGKARGDHRMGQDEINQTIVRHAKAGHRVVRLKGGDPFIFGRGGEELDALRAHGIEAEIVPGITAALGCAAIAGIPLTHRDHARTVTLVTGEGRDGALEADWRAVARGGHTVVVYMGIANAGRIAEQLINHGRDAATPIAVIENGSLPEQRVLAGRLDGLGALMADEAVTSPALVVIGDVAAYAKTHELGDTSAQDFTTLAIG